MINLFWYDKILLMCNLDGEIKRFKSFADAIFKLTEATESN